MQAVATGLKFLLHNLCVIKKKFQATTKMVSNVSSNFSLYNSILLKIITRPRKNYIFYTNHENDFFTTFTVIKNDISIPDVLVFIRTGRKILPRVSNTNDAPSEYQGESLYLVTHQAPRVRKRAQLFVVFINILLCSTLLYFSLLCSTTDEYCRVLDTSAFAICEQRYKLHIDLSVFL